MDKIWYIFTMEDYSADQNNDNIKFAGKWMELENIMPSDITQTQKEIHDMYSYIAVKYVPTTQRS